jgi:hypothetical protein
MARRWNDCEKSEAGYTVSVVRWSPRRIIERNEAAARYSHQVELVEPEMIRERIEIPGNAAGLRAGRRIGQALAPVAAIEGDDTIAFPSEGGRLGSFYSWGPGRPRWAPLT